MASLGVVAVEIASAGENDHALAVRAAGGWRVFAGPHRLGGLAGTYADGVLGFGCPHSCPAPAGNCAHVWPSSSLPISVLGPLDCLKKNGTLAARHWSRMVRAQAWSIGR